MSLNCFACARGLLTRSHRCQSHSAAAKVPRRRLPKRKAVERSKMITPGNYFERSHGTFDLLPRKVVANILNSRLFHNRGIEINGRWWYVDHLSYDKHARAVASVYLVSNDQRFLIRISDHWTAGRPIRKGDAKQCFSIARCWWQLKKGGQTVTFNGVPWQGGIIEFKHLKQH